MTLADLERLARAATPAGGGDISPLLDACSPERILGLLARVRELEEGLRESLYWWRGHLDGPAGTPESAQHEWDRETALRSLLAKERGE